MKKLLLPLAIAGVIGACSSDAGGVDPDAIPAAEKHAVWMALDSAFLHDPVLDPAFTGDTGFYATLSKIVIPFVDRASRIPVAGDTTRVVGIEFDIDATQRGTHIVANLTGILAWKGYDSTSRTVDTVFFLIGTGRAPITDSLWSRFTLESPGTGTGFVVHQAPDSTVTKWLSRAGHLHTTASQYGAKQGGSTFNVARGTLDGEFTISAKLVPDSATTVTSALDFGSGARSVKAVIRGTLP